MTLFGRDVLFVGQSFHSSDSLTDRRHQWGFQCHLATHARAAADLLNSHPIDLVLRNTRLANACIPNFLSHKRGSSEELSPT